MPLPKPALACATVAAALAAAARQALLATWRLVDGPALMRRWQHLVTGKTATSAPVSVVVRPPNVAPSVSITSPANGAVFG